MKCLYCNKEFNTAQAKSSHERLCKMNPSRKIINKNYTNKLKNGELTTWNKGLTKENNKIVKQISDKITGKQTWLGKHHTDETKKKLALFGGYRKGSGRGKHGRYRSYYCDSSWELAFVIYNLEHGITFTRNTEKFEYVFENKTHKYMPDWKIDDTYIEIKGYWTEQWQAKLNQFPKDKNLIIIDKETIKPYLEYTISKYGKDFVRLYE